jgi:outer membrane lipoprotein SlyB
MPGQPSFRVALRCVVSASLIGFGLVACAPTNTGTTYSRAALGQVGSVSFGTVVGMRPVQIAGSQSGVGAVAGAAAGGLGLGKIMGAPGGGIASGLSKMVERKMFGQDFGEGVPHFARGVVADVAYRVDGLVRRTSR